LLVSWWREKSLHVILLCVILAMFLPLGSAWGASKRFTADLTGTNKFGAPRVDWFQAPDTYWGEEGTHFVAAGRLWLYYKSYSRNDLYRFTDDFWDKNANPGIGLVDIVLIAKNYGLQPQAGDRENFGIPIYKVRFYPRNAKTTKFLGQWPAVNTLNLTNNSGNTVFSLPLQMPVNRTVSSGGYIETDWIACPNCFGLSMDPEVKLTETKYGAREDLAGQYGFKPKSPYPELRPFSMGYGEVRFKPEEYLIGDKAVAWAKASGQTLLARRNRLSDAPRRYTELVAAYKELTPSAKLAKKCPNRITSRYSFIAAREAPELRAEIREIESDYDKLITCFDTFFKIYDSSLWLQLLPDYAAKEEDLSRVAEVRKSDRYEMTVEAEKSRINDYVSKAENDADEVITRRVNVGATWARQQEDADRKAQMYTNLQKSMKATADRFARNVEQSRYEADLRRNQMAMAANPGARSVETLTPGTTLDVAKLNADLAKQRREREAMKSQDRMAQAEAGTATDDDAPAEKAEPQKKAAAADNAKPAAKAATRPKPAETPAPKPETPPEPIHIYSAISADSLDEGVGTPKSNLIYDMEGTVIRVEDFYRSYKTCSIGQGRMLVIEWTYLKGGNPEFGRGYFSTAPEAAIYYWHFKKLNDAGDEQVFSKESSVKSLSKNKDCQTFETRFIDY